MWASRRATRHWLPICLDSALGCRAMRSDRLRPPSPRRPTARPFAVTSTAVALTLALALASAACDRPPASTREWTPQDHDRADEKERVASGAQAAARPKGSE